MAMADFPRARWGCKWSPHHPRVRLAFKRPWPEFTAARSFLVFLAAWLLALAGAPAHARLIEQIIKVPVKVTDAYGKDDQWMGPRYPREWFGAFKAEGGVGEFVQFPPHGKDGHGLFTQAPEVWRPTALSFLRTNGFPELKERVPLPK